MSRPRLEPAVRAKIPTQTAPVPEPKTLPAACDELFGISSACLSCDVVTVLVGFVSDVIYDRFLSLVTSALQRARALELTL